MQKYYIINNKSAKNENGNLHIIEQDYTTDYEVYGSCPMIDELDGVVFDDAKSSSNLVDIASMFASYASHQQCNHCWQILNGERKFHILNSEDGHVDGD